jgi:hypothetical protein
MSLLQPNTTTTLCTRCTEIFRRDQIDGASNGSGHDSHHETLVALREAASQGCYICTIVQAGEDDLARRTQEHNVQFKKFNAVIELDYPDVSSGPATRYELRDMTEYRYVHLTIWYGRRVHYFKIHQG